MQVFFILMKMATVTVVLEFVTQCQSPGSSYVLISGDCHDDHPDIFPMAIEIPADNVDQNCDGFEICYEDMDGDEYGSSVTISTEDITCSGDGISFQSGDCDDNTIQTSPNQSEICDGIDNDCNNTIDDNPEDGIVYFGGFRWRWLRQSRGVLCAM